MKNDPVDGPGTRDHFDDLRRLAEDALAGEPDDLALYSQRDLKQLVHDLRVHQVELEMQNLALRESENALSLARDEYAELYDQAPVGYVSVDADGFVTRANLTVTHMFGTPRHGLSGYAFHRYVARQDQDAYHLFVVHLVQSGTAETTELTMQRADSSEFRARVHGISARDGSGRWRATIRDITVEHAAQDALGRRTEELEVLNRTNRALAGSLEMTAVLRTALDALRDLFGVAGAAAWIAEDVGGEAHIHLAYDRFDDPAAAPFRRLAPKMGESLAHRTIEVGHMVCDHLIPSAQSSGETATGEKEHVRWMLSVLVRAEGAPLGVLQVFDAQPRAFGPREQTLAESIGAATATAMQRAQLYDQARLDADVRATLLREVNHRVKNNLSAILGLIFAERRRLGQGVEQNADKVLNDLASRVGSLATVHTILSEAGWQPLNLADLATEIVRMAVASVEEIDAITVEINPCPIRVTPDQAHYLSLALCELVTNTAKYRRSGEGVRIQIHIAAEDGQVRLVYRDGGPGYPAAVLAGGGRSVGLWLVDSIMRANLRGQWTMAADDGAVTELRFPLATEGNG